MADLTVFYISRKNSCKNDSPQIETSNNPVKKITACPMADKFKTQQLNQIKLNQDRSNYIKLNHVKSFHIKLNQNKLN